MLVTLLLISLASLTVGEGPVRCPVLTGMSLEDYEARSVQTAYKRLYNTFKNATSNSTYLADMEMSDSICNQPTIPSDEREKRVKKRALPQSELRPPFQLRPQFPKDCEPCPPKQHFLGRFYGSCYVLAPAHQQVRFVTCDPDCFAPCMCSNSYCQRTAWVRVWFFSYCFGNPPTTLFQPGLNFQYLWLSQDCTCKNV